MAIVCPPRNKNAQFSAVLRAAGQSGPTFTLAITGLTGGVARIGVELMAVADGWSDGAPGSVSFTWNNVAGTPSGANYTPVAGDDLEAISVTATPSETYDARTSASYTVRYAPPTASGGLSDQSFTEDNGVQTYDVSGDFTGSGGTWSLPTTISGVTINGSGVVQIDTDALAVQADTSIVARYTNSGGVANSGFGLTITEDTTPALSTTVDGEMEIDGSGNISLTVTAPAGYAGGPYTTDQSTAATGNLNTGSIETGPQCAVVPAITRTSGASDTVGAVYTRVSGLWLYDGDDTLTVAGEWYLDDVATGETGATYTSDTAGAVEWRDSATGAGVARTAISNEITVAAAATVPAQMSAPAVTATGSDSISVDRAAAPSDGGSTITSYDLRWQEDGGSWVIVTGISDPETVSSLAASTLHNVQTRAVNAVGAGTWSASGSATTDAGSTAVFTEPFSYADGVRVRDQADWTAIGNSGGVMRVTSGEAYIVGSGFEVVRYNGNSGAVAGDQYAEIEVVTAPASGSDQVILYLRAGAGTIAYTLDCDSAGVAIKRNNTSIWTGSAISDGDVIRLEADGTIIRYLLNGTQQTSIDDTGEGGPTSGDVQLLLADGVYADNFECGDL
jgi:hypothetical protein